jgi:hypothetical protein
VAEDRKAVRAIDVLAECHGPSCATSLPMSPVASPPTRNADQSHQAQQIEARIARNINHGLVPERIVEARGEEIVDTFLAHVAERPGGPGVLHLVPHRPARVRIPSSYYGRPSICACER